MAYIFQDDDEKYKIYKSYSKKLIKILTNAKDKIKNYYKTIVYLTPEDLDSINKGIHTTITIFTKRSKININIPAILYLTKKQISQYIIDKYSDEKFNLTLSKKTNFRNPVSIINKIWDDKDDLSIKRDREYDKFIADLMKYSSKTPMLGNRKQKVGKVIKSLLDERLKVGRYYQALVKLNAKQIHDILKECTQGNTKGDFIINFKPISRLKLFPFILFLTKNQKIFYEAWENNKNEFELVMSNTQFHKTCFATILLNRDIYYYSKYEVLPPPPKIKGIDTPLAIEMKNLINFAENTNPPTSKTKPDLIPTSKTKPDPVSKIDELMKKHLLDFTKDSYKNYTQKQSFKKIENEVLNALLNEINYPLTKDILGLRLTKNLKEKISKQTLEAAVGLTWIIRSLVLSNKGKLPVYYENNNYYQLSRNQIK